jgi:hypothetical protein
MPFNFCEQCTKSVSKNARPKDNNFLPKQKSLLTVPNTFITKSWENGERLRKKDE